jgi:DNA-binding transcriptional MerR regulator
MPNTRPKDEVDDALQRQREGSRKGADLVRAEFAAALTRRRFCEIVGIHEMTLKRWEREEVVSPRTEVILNSPTRVFAPEDVTFGKRLIALLRERSGTLSLREAAALIRGDSDRA